jgi:hypothetical protein
VNRHLSFLATLDLPDLSRILNDPILHSPYWAIIPDKLPSDIPKFDGRSGEDPNNHVMTFHLWCSSNSLMDDSIILHLFQRTLTGSTSKQYIELPQGFFNDFNTLAMDLLTHYQLPIRYKTGTKILSSFKQSSSTHISDHIHEWRRRRCLMKVPLSDQLLAEWFTKSLIGPIACDVAMGGVVTKDKVISCAQYLDLVYSQTNTLYDLIPDAPRPYTNATPTPPVASHAADGVIVTFHAETQSKQASHSNPKSNTTNVQNTPPPIPSPSKTCEVNLVQFAPTGKKKKKRKGAKRIRRIRIIINKPINPRLSPLTKKKSANLIILVLFVVRIIIRKIVHNVPRLLSSCKGSRHLLHPPFCHNLFLLSNSPNWSFMTNLPPLPNLMYLCALVTPRRTKLQSLLEPNIILLQKRKLMIHHLHLFNLLHKLHLPTILFILND